MIWEKKNTYVNLHYHKDEVFKYLNRPHLKEWVHAVYEKELLGTAGSIRNLYPLIKNKIIVLIHADNWSLCDLNKFINFHLDNRPDDCVISMMTFISDSPKECGIVEVDQQGVVVGFHEKVTAPPGNIANAAIYVIEPEVLDWIMANPLAHDFSSQVIPAFIGRIVSWQNESIHRDIGTVRNLLLAQSEYF